MQNNLTTRLKQYFKNKPEVIAVYLFGSQATGQKKASSDVDIGILLDTKDRVSEIEKRNQYMLDLADILRKEIHPVILNSAGEELLRQIFAKGDCIFIRNQKKLSFFKMIMFSKIADFGYYRKQMQSGLIRSITET